MYSYNIKKINLREIRSDFIEFFPYILKDKSFEKIIKEYQYIAYAENKLGKVVSCVLFKEYLEFPKVWQLGRISTNKKYFKKGIASNLLLKIIDFIKNKKGVKILVYVSEENKVAQSFYLKNKFKKEAKIDKMKLGRELLFIFTREVF